MKTKPDRKSHLIEELLKLSEAPEWEQAQFEWELKFIAWASIEDDESCICGHHPIVELCNIRNNKTEQETIVGNCCVNKVTDLPSKAIFKSLKKVKKNLSKPLDDEVIELAFDNGWINTWEYNFFADTNYLIWPTSKQLAMRRKLNEKILNKVKPKGDQTK